MDKYQTIKHACTVLGLAETATRSEITHHYKSLIARWHPDKCKEEPELCREKSEEIIRAYRLIKEYCDNYKFSFRKEEVEQHLSAEEWWLKTFGNDPLWNNG